eukprot:UN12199
MAEAEEDDDQTTSTSSSSFDEEEEEENDELQQLQQLLQRPPRSYMHHQNQQQQQQAQGDDDRILIKTMLQTLGFEKKYIDKAIRVYEKNYGRGNYNPDDITQIILRLQEKDEIKKQKEQLLVMNLEPKLAEEIFGRGKYGFASKSKSKTKTKTSGYHSGDIVIYRNEIRAQVLDKLDDYLQISWPINKAIYQRAILWIHIFHIKRREKSP